MSNTSSCDFMCCLLLVLLCTRMYMSNNERTCEKLVPSEFGHGAYFRLFLIFFVRFLFLFCLVYACVDAMLFGVSKGAQRPAKDNDTRNQHTVNIQELGSEIIRKSLLQTDLFHGNA